MLPKIQPKNEDEDENEDNDDDEIAIFRPVLAKIDLDFLPSFALAIRRRIELAKSKGQDIVPPTIKCNAIAPILTGSDHIVFPLGFSDGPRWVLKVPARGCISHWCEVSARSLAAEARTMHLLKRKTTIPLPEVYAFGSSLDNELRVPFILMEFIDGVALHKVWFNRAVSESSLEQIRRTALEELAFAMVQLNDFAYNQCGSLEFDQKGDVVGIGPFADLSPSKPYEPSELNQSILDELGIMCQSGPFQNPREYLLYDVDYRQPPGTNLCRGELMDRYDHGAYKLLRIFIDWVPFTPHKEGLDFVLMFPEFSPQNILVTEEGHLRGLIDWDSVITMPRCLGCETYPSWLTRDWDSITYRYNPTVEKNEQRENSPEELAHYRTLYDQFMHSALAEKHRSDHSNHSASDSTTESKIQISTSLTRNSLLIQNLAIAAGSAAFCDSILLKIFEKIKEITAPKWDTESSFAEVDDMEIKDSEKAEELVDVMMAQTASQVDRFVIVLRSSFSSEISYQSNVFMRAIANKFIQCQSVIANLLKWTIPSLGFLIDFLHAQNHHRSDPSQTPLDSLDQNEEQNGTESLPTKSKNTIDFKDTFGKQDATASKKDVPVLSGNNELENESTTSKVHSSNIPSKQTETASQSKKETTNPTTITTDDQSGNFDQETADEPESISKAELDALTDQGFEYYEVIKALANDALDEDRMQRLKEGFIALLA